MSENGPQPRFTKEQIAEALTAARGNISAAARSLEIRRQRLKDRIDEDPELISIVDEERAMLVDKAEENVANGVYAGDSQDSRYILSTLGKDRGFSTRQENTGPGGKAIPFQGEININFKAPQSTDQDDGDASGGSAP